ncbi:MAG: FkbM family methyltransferase [Bacteroidales bacterium]|nr:FkbM family methyltransferase [Bacteroidales bacterium]
MNRLYENRNHDIQSNGELTVLKKLAAFHPQVIIDGGANIGEYSRRTADILKGVRIYSFEPVKSTFEMLVSNLKGNQNIIPVNKGLYHENCVRNINLFPSHTHSSLYDIQGLSYDTVRTDAIELIAGDTFMEQQNIAHIDLLKLDLEGAEYDALLGFQNAMKNGKITMVQFEFGYINITTKKLLIDFYKWFESYGYTVGKVFPKTVEFRKYEYKYEDFLGPNYVAVKKSDTRLIEKLKRK